MIEVRPVFKGDLDSLKIVLDSIELFPSEMLDDMISDYFNNPDSEDIWFTVIDQGKSISIGYCAPEKLTNGTFNLLAIGVLSDFHGKGGGRKMMAYIEEVLTNMGHRILIVETSSVEAYESTNRFYENLGYSKEAIIPDFWDQGDDKVILWKKLVA